MLNLRFAGQTYDRESGLNHNVRRDYDPVTGRYVQADPIGLDGGISLYGYVSGNPLGFVDPLGLAQCAVREGEAGRFGNLKSREVSGDDLEAHHMPQAALDFTARNDGGALSITHDEHVLTRTYGLKGRASALEDAGSSFRDVLAKDIKDIRNITGTKYNAGLRDLTNYYRTSFPDLIAKGP